MHHKLRRFGNKIFPLRYVFIDAMLMSMSMSMSVLDPRVMASVGGWRYRSSSGTSYRVLLWCTEKADCSVFEYDFLVAPIHFASSCPFYLVLLCSFFLSPITACLASLRFV